MCSDVRFGIYTRRKHNNNHVQIIYKKKKYQLNNDGSDQFHMIPAATIMFIYRWIQEQVRFGVSHKKKYSISPISVTKFSGEKEREQSFSEWIPARTSAQF